MFGRQDLPLQENSHSEKVHLEICYPSLMTNEINYLTIYSHFIIPKKPRKKQQMAPPEYQLLPKYTLWITLFVSGKN